MPPPLPLLEITSRLRSQIDEQATRDYPHETCGLLLGHFDDAVYRVTRLFPAENVETFDPRRRYRADSATYRDAESLALHEGLTILGVYHSHTESPAEPSEIDSEFAFPGWVYWITPVFSDGAGQARVWLREEDTERWREIESVPKD